MDFFRLGERLNFAPCSSDGMRVDAWRVALQGAKTNLLLPAPEPYDVYYKKNEIGQYTEYKCHTVFVTVHNYYLEQLYYGGILWLILLALSLGYVVSRTWKTTLGIGFISYLVFIGVSPTYFVFHIVLLSWIFLMYTPKVEDY